MFQQRVHRFRQNLIKLGINAFLISNFYNILYLSGFKTLVDDEREAWMLVTAENSYLFSDSRYLGDKLETTYGESNLNNKFLITKLITPEKGLMKQLEEIFQKENIKICGVEGDDLKLVEFQHFIQHFRQIKFIPTEKLIIKQRETKDSNEIENIKKACEISDSCLKDIIKTIRVGQMEKEIALKIEFWLKERYFDLAFYPIVAIDENSAVIHYDTRGDGSKKVKKGSVILIDFGAKFKDYLSDITRMVFVGEPSEEIKREYERLKDVQQKSIKLLRNGVVSRVVDLFCRKPLLFPHATGHGVGLEIHEYPKISPIEEKKLLTNQIITIEPGVYYQGKWGMRIEDTLVIKENQAMALTNFSRELTVI